jgi:D-glycero-D-manno-heptose 1,7-bisphosphate phosphatase
MNNAIFFDRDGVLNELVSRDGGQYSPQSFSQFKLFPGLKSLFLKIKSKGWLIIIVSNQPDVARGQLDEAELQQMSDKLNRDLNPDDTFYCVHDDPDIHGCRKPSPGLFYQAAKKWNIDLNKSYMVGDTWKDVEAAKNAKVNMLLLSKDYNKNLDYTNRIKKIEEILEYL